MDELDKLDKFVDEHLVTPDQIVAFPCIRVMSVSFYFGGAVAVAAIAPMSIRSGGGWYNLDFCQSWLDWPRFVEDARKEAERQGIPLYIDRGFVEKSRDLLNRVRELDALNREKEINHDPESKRQQQDS